MNGAARSAQTGRWRRIGLYVAIGAAMKLIEMFSESLRTDSVLLLDTAQTFWTYKIDSLARTWLTLPLLALLLYRLDAIMLTGWRRHLVSAALLLVYSIACAIVMSMMPWPLAALRVGATASLEAWFLYSLWINLLIGQLAIVGLDGLRANDRAARRLAAVHEAGRIARERLAHTRLSAIQARVDPQLLWDLLAAVKRAYARDAGHAERLLDELTAYLRAALPRLRTVRSTLEIEFGLVAAYVRLLRSAFAASVDLQVRLPGPLADAAFPAGLLMPLIPRCAGAPQGLVLEADARDGCLRIGVQRDLAFDDADVERLRESLADLYGPRAGLSVQEGPFRLELELPHEPA